MRVAMVMAALVLVVAPAPARADDAWLGIIFAQRGGGGVVIGEVLPGGPAEAAGLNPGDTLVALDGTQLFGPGDLIAAIAGHQVGDRVTLSVFDDDTLADVVVELGAREPDDLVTVRRLVGRAAPSRRLLAPTADRRVVVGGAGRVVVEAWFSADCIDCNAVLDAIDARRAAWPDTRVIGVVPATIDALRSWRAVAATSLPLARVGDATTLTTLSIDSGRRGVTLVAMRGDRIGAAAYLATDADGDARAQRLDEFAAALASLTPARP